MTAKDEQPDKEPEEMGLVPVVREDAELQQARLEIDSQITTARRFPRDLKTFFRRATEIVQYDEELANDCFYSLPRAGKNIRGPSIRLAEIVASTYGNLQTGVKLKEVQDKYVVAEAAVWDMESNNRHQEDATRKITDKKGKRFAEDMIATTIGACRSIALRNAIFRIIPKAYVRRIEDAAAKVISGDERSFPKRRQDAIDWLTQKIGIPLKCVLGAVGCERVEDMTPNDLVDLRALATSCKDGIRSWQEAFPYPAAKKTYEMPDAAEVISSAATPKKPLLRDLDPTRPADDDSVREPGEEG